MEIVDGTPKITCRVDQLSQTTLRHIKEFLKQKGFKAETKQQIIRDYLKESLNNVNLETDHDIISISSETKPEDEGEEMIAPLDDMDIDEITSDEEEEIVDDEFSDDEDIDFEDEDVEEEDEEMAESLNEGAFNGGPGSDGGIDNYKRPGGSTQPSKNGYLTKIKNKNPELVDIMTIKGKEIKPGMITQHGQVRSAEVKKNNYGETKVYIMHTNGFDGFWELDDTFEIMIDPDDKNKPFTGDFRDLLKRGLKESEEVVDIDIDEIDEKDINRLGESYLKNIYSNVSSYKTTDCATKGNKLFIEGLITFKSGKKKSTRFVFEAKEVTKRGKVKFIGENTQITPNKHPFTLLGKVKNGKLLAESFTYNYREQNPKTKKSQRVYGRVVSNKRG